MIRAAIVKLRPDMLNRVFRLFLLVAFAILTLNVLVPVKTLSQAQVNSRAPSNDAFSAAAVLTFPSTVTVSDIALATIESGEPLHGCRRFAARTGSYSVWYRFTLSQPGEVTLSTLSSQLSPAEDSILSIYQGESLATLSEVACNDDAGGSLYSVVEANLQAGNYFIKASYWPNNVTPPNTPMDSSSTLVLAASFEANAVTLTPSQTPTQTQIPPSTFTNTPNPSEVTATQTPTTAPPTATATPTKASAVANLIQNGDFEFDTDVDKIPDGWMGVELSKDKRACNTSKKIVAHHGMCAFQFKNKEGESSQLTQFIPVETLSSGSTLVFSGAFEVPQPVGKAVILKISYAEADAGLKGKGKDKVKLKLEAITYGYSRLSQSFTLLGTPTRLLVKLVHQRQGTRLLVDDLSLKRQ